MSAFDEEEVADPVAEMGFDQHVHMTAAIRLGLEIKQDFSAEGPLADYAHYVEEQAVRGMAILVTIDPTNVAAIMLAQKNIAAYAHLMGWLKDTMARAEQDEAQIEIRREGATEELL